MKITLIPRLQRYLEGQLAVGRFRDASEAIAAGLSLLEQKQQVTSLLQISSTVKTRAYSYALGDLSGMDIAELSFIILMEAARSAQEDLREIMAEVKAINDAKSETRAILTRMNCDIDANADQQGGKPSLKFSRQGLGSAKAYRQLALPQPDPTCLGGVRRVPVDPNQAPIKDLASLRAIHEQARNNLDSLSDLGELASLRLQMVMDRRSKAMTTLSNLLKTISDTQNTIIGNLK